VLHETERGKDLARYLNGRKKLTPAPEVVEIFGLCQQAPDHRAMARLSLLLSAFSFSPAVHETAERVGVFWRPLKGKEFSSWIKSILDLLESGALARVRQCICRKWFYATSNKKQVCSDACRARKFSEGTNRSEYMRGYRATLKGRKQP